MRGLRRSRRRLALGLAGRLGACLLLSGAGSLAGAAGSGEALDAVAAAAGGGDALDAVATGACERSPVFALAVHGGAAEDADALRGELRAIVLEKGPAFLERALARGRALLRAGATGLDTVQAVVGAMEDSGLFNAGRGSIRNAEGVVECEAALMDGRSGRVGAVAVMRRLASPITAARLVMERSPHALLAGPDAERLLRGWGAEPVAPDYFRRGGSTADARGADAGGTVGAVALDRCGDLAAATSSGGRTGKLPGRVSDTPIPGAGTWARNGSVAVSATGHGEYILRAAAAHEIAALVDHAGLDARAAAERVVRRLAEQGGAAGVIVVDSRGNAAVAFNTELMVRGIATHERAPEVSVR